MIRGPRISMVRSQMDMTPAAAVVAATTGALY